MRHKNFPLHTEQGQTTHLAGWGGWRCLTFYTITGPLIFSRWFTGRFIGWFIFTPAMGQRVPRWSRLHAIQYPVTSPGKTCQPHCDYRPWKYGPSLGLILNITSHCLFCPFLIDSAFQIWFTKGFKCVKDSSQDNNFTMTPFEAVFKTFHALISVQVRNFVRRLLASFPPAPTQGWIEDFLHWDPRHRGLI